MVITERKIGSSTKDECLNYDPNRARPLGVASVKSGALFVCKKFKARKPTEIGCYYCVSKELPTTSS